MSATRPNCARCFRKAVIELTTETEVRLSCGIHRAELERELRLTQSGAVRAKVLLGDMQRGTP